MGGCDSQMSKAHVRLLHPPGCATAEGHDDLQRSARGEARRFYDNEALQLQW